MTDKDFIVPIRCYLFEEHNCKHCIYLHHAQGELCDELLYRDIVNFVNSLKTENERLKQENQQLIEKINCQETFYSDLRRIIKEQTEILKTITIATHKETKPVDDECWCEECKCFKTIKENEDFGVCNLDGELKMFCRLGCGNFEKGKEKSQI